MELNMMHKCSRRRPLQQMVTNAHSNQVMTPIIISKQFLHSCKDALTDRSRTRPGGNFLTEQLARPHPRIPDFSGTVWPPSNYIVLLRNIKRWGENMNRFN